VDGAVGDAARFVHNSVQCAIYALIGAHLCRGRVHVAIRRDGTLDSMLPVRAPPRRLARHREGRESLLHELCELRKGGPQFFGVPTCYNGNDVAPLEHHGRDQYAQQRIGDQSSTTPVPLVDVG